MGQKTIEKNCEYCGKSIVVFFSEHKRGFGKYCNLTCSARSKPCKIHKPNTSCAMCNKQIHKTESRLGTAKSGLNFCGRACKDKAQRIGGLKALQLPHYGITSKDYRTIAFREYAHECRECKWNKHPEVLEVHHKDTNRENNKLDNLEILCPTCHFTHHFLTKTGKWGRRKPPQSPTTHRLALDRPSRV